MLRKVDELMQVCDIITAEFRTIILFKIIKNVKQMYFYLSVKFQKVLIVSSI